MAEPGAPRTNKSIVGDLADKLKLIVGLVGSVTSILALVGGAVTWAISPITAKLDALEQSTYRNELMTLMANYPEDKRAIEGVAYRYFAELKGDTYVFSLYTQWANAHDVDASVITEIHNLNNNSP